jgi:hypothetical protein
VLEPGTTGSWIASAALAAALLGGTAIWVQLIIGLGRNARRALERRLDITIDRELGVWQVSEESWREYPDSRVRLSLAVNGTWVALRVLPIFVWLIALGAVWVALH